MAQQARDAKRKDMGKTSPTRAPKAGNRSAFPEEEALTLERNYPASGAHASRWEQIDDLLEAHPAPVRRSAPPRARISLWEEVHVDELIEVADPSPPWSEPLPEAKPLPTPGPVAFDVEAPSTMRSPMDTAPAMTVRAARAKRVRIGIAIAGIAAVMGGVFLAARAPKWRAAKHSAATAAIVAPPPPAPVPAAPPTPPAPLADVTPPPPRATTGTAIGSPGHRLYVDGRVVPGWKAEVTCGAHTFKFGAKGKVRTVEVPCGGEVTIVP